MSAAARVRRTARHACSAVDDCREQEPIARLRRCGPGTHALGLAAAGVREVVGLELNPTMLGYALAKAAKQREQQQQQQGGGSKTGGGKAAAGSSKPPKGTVAFVQGDMREVGAALQGGAAAAVAPAGGAGGGGGGSGNGAGPAGAAGVVDVRAPYDMATCLLGTMMHMLTNEDALRVFRGVAAALRPGGLFVVELAHPGQCGGVAVALLGGGAGVEVVVAVVVVDRRAVCGLELAHPGRCRRGGGASWWRGRAGLFIRGGAGASSSVACHNGSCSGGG